MSKARTALLVIISFCVLGAGLVLFVFASIHGYFDHGQFEIKSEEWNSSHQIAVIARRSDHEALNGDQYFALLGSHPPSAVELRHAYYHDQLLFRAGSSCIKIKWETPQHLVIECADKSIQSDEIAVEKDHYGDVAVSYLGIPAKQ